MSAAARATSARATGERVEKIGIAASSSGVSMLYLPSSPGANHSGAGALQSGLQGPALSDVWPPAPRAGFSSRGIRGPLHQSWSLSSGSASSGEPSVSLGPSAPGLIFG